MKRIIKANLVRSTIVIAGLFSVACSKLPETATSVDPSEAVIEAGLSMVSGAADEQSNGSFAMQKSNPSFLLFLAGEKAYAAACMRAVMQSCEGQVKTVTYDDCQLGMSNKTFSGQVTLSYSAIGCSMINTGDAVTRTYNASISGPRGGYLDLTSNVNSDYRGASFGGGTRLTKTISGHELEILGRHSRLVGPRGRVLYDVSVRTLANLQLAGGLSRSARTVTGGQIEVNHNLAQFTAIFTASNLQWSASCCHPVAGSVSVDYSGSKSGTANVTFTGCGSADLVQDGQSKVVQLSYCE